MSTKINFERKAQQVKERRENRPNSYRQLRYTKLIAETVKRIVKNDNKILKKNDLSEICIKVYGKTNRIKEIRVRTMLNSDIAKNDIDNELQRIYTDAGLSKDEIKPLLANIKAWIEEKKDITNAMKLVDKLEKTHNLEQKPDIKAHETLEFNSFSSLKDNKPDKITQTLTEDNKTLKLVVKQPKDDEIAKSIDPSE